MKFKFLIFLMSFSLPALGLVDMKNANYSKTFIDFKVESSAFPLKLERTYNSRSLYRGFLGMGWCSNLETRVDILPDGSPKVTICGDGLEIVYSNNNQKPNLSYQVDQIIKVVKSQNKNLKANYLKGLKSRLNKSHVLKNEFLRAYHIKGKPKANQNYFAEGVKNDTIQYNKKGFFRRILPSGAHQFFRASDGRMIQISDRLGNYFKIVWKGSRPEYLTDNQGRRVVFKSQDGRIHVSGLGKSLGIYSMKDGNLVSVKTSDGTYLYQYDELHNLTNITYPASGKNSSTKESLTYNIKKDWVLSFTNARNCVEKYNYKTNKKNANHYWTDVVKKCGDVITNQSRYEYWNKKSKNGNMYLHRARQDVNGDIRDVVYDNEFKRAIRVNDNGLVTQYDFYRKGAYKGLLRNKKDSILNVSYQSYHPTCLKPNQVSLSSNSKQAQSQNKSQILKITFNSLSCLTKKVERSDGLWVGLTHDEKGRITSMKDQSGTNIKMGYHPKFNTLSNISQEGVGTVSMNIDKKTGKNKGFKKSSDSFTITSVMRVFNGFLEIIEPVSSGFSI